MIKLRYASIRNMDITNGKGIACSIFFQGCSNHCVGCFNKETWDFNGGKKFTKELQDKFIELCSSPMIDCISLLGGEPLDQPLDELECFLNRLQALNKPIYLWSDYLFDNLTKEQLQVVKCVDILIDGKFEQDKKDLTLKLRGSSNQRIIDVQKSLSTNSIILLDN